MYSINNIPLETFGIIAGRANNSTIALSGHLDMPKRLGKAFQNWDDEQGLEPYVNIDEITFEGRDLVFNGYLKATDKQMALNQLTSLYSNLNALTDLVPFSTPWGVYEVYIQDEIEAQYIGNGAAQLEIIFREPIVLVTAQVPNGTSEEIYNIDGVALKSLGAFVTEVQGNFYNPKHKEARFTAYGSEGFQITKTESLLIETSLVFAAETYTELAANVQKLHKLLAAPGTRKMNVDGKARECFNVEGFEVNSIKIANNLAICQLTFEMLTARDGDPLDTGYMLDNEYNNIVTNLYELIKIKS